MDPTVAHWDIEHVRRHDVTPEEVDEVLANPSSLSSMTISHAESIQLQPTNPMTKKVSSSQRQKHEKIEDEFLRSRLSLADIENADSVTLEAYQILQETLVMLRRKRTEAGLTLDDVATASGTDKAYLSRLENGKVLNPTFETLYRYAAAIDRSTP